MLGGKHRQDYGTLVSILNAANSLNAANDATVSTPQLSFPQDRPNLSVLLPWPTTSTLCHLPMVAPFAKDEIRGPLSLQTPRPPSKHWQGKPTTARPFNQLMKGVSTAG